MDRENRVNPYPETRPSWFGSSGQLRSVTRGIVLRQRFARDGTHHVVGIYFPGEIANVLSFLHGDEAREHYAKLDDAAMDSISAKELIKRPDGETLLIAALARELSIADEHAFQLAHRSALQRLAHFFCEAHHRSGAAAGEYAIYPLPLNQQVFGAYLGITAVHFNRVMQTLRTDDLVEFAKGQVEIRDRRKLEAIAEFDPDYLLAKTGN